MPIGANAGILTLTAMITEELLGAYEYVHTILLILSVLTNSTLILLILRFSPKQMHSYRLYLLNLTVC